MSEGRSIDLVRRMHRLPAEGRRRILHESDVVAEFHAETAGRFDAGIRQHANDDNLVDPKLFQLVVEVGVRETALRPVLFDNDVALLRLEIIVKRPAPRIFGKRLALARGNLCMVRMLPFRVIARLPTMMRHEKHLHARLAGRINDGSQVRQKVHGLCHLFGQWPKLALRGEEVVIGVDEKKSARCL
jgi:hypothetical protein